MSETIEELKSRLKREDEEAERNFQKTLQEAHAAAGPWRARKEKEAREKELRQERLVQESQQKRAQEAKDEARRSYLDAGGTYEDFEEAWPEIKAERLKRAAIEGESMPRAESVRRTIHSF
jgi:hypothetical protein